MIELLALPYAAGGSHGTPRPVAQVHFDVYPAGDIFLTPEDMARFLGAHLNGGVFNGNRILSEASVREMHRPRFGGTYGLGFWARRDSASGHTIIDHGGSVPGLTAVMLGDLDARVGVYYMSNSGAPTDIGEAALKLLRGEAYVPAPERKSVAVEAGTLDRYVGTYRLEAGGVVTIARDGRALVVQQGESPARNELLAESPTRFRVRNSNTTITFPGGDAGAPERLELATGNQTRAAKRIR
jgi:hypothetical protein